MKIHAEDGRTIEFHFQGVENGNFVGRAKFGRKFMKNRCENRRNCLCFAEKHANLFGEQNTDSGINFRGEENRNFAGLTLCQTVKVLFMNF